jgi:hypothetical protein
MGSWTIYAGRRFIWAHRAKHRDHGIMLLGGGECLFTSLRKEVACRASTLRPLSAGYFSLPWEPLS